jgi:hypothetical protein
VVPLQLAVPQRSAVVLPLVVLPLLALALAVLPVVGVWPPPLHVVLSTWEHAAVAERS